MLLFACAPTALLDAIEREGLPADTPLYQTLAQAEAACSPEAHVLALDRAHLPLAPDGELVLAGPVSPEALLNLRPFLPVRDVPAAGGYVVRAGAHGPEVLLIFRRGVWDLPKGKLDPGETPDAAALREVREEVGITDLHLLQPAGTTLHGYAEKNRYCVKTTYWYTMTTPETAFTPQASEQIEAVAWVPWAEAVPRLGFATLRTHMARLDPDALGL